MKDRVAALCVGLAADCDPPGEEEAVRNLMAANLRNAGALPMGAFVTADLKWVGGFSGYQDEAAFTAHLDAAEKSPVLQAAPDVAKKLALLGAAAEAAAAKSEWPKVFTSAREAKALTGRHPAREKIAAAFAKARAWADGEMKSVRDSVQSGGDRAAARAALKKVSAAAAGEPEAKEADAGVTALEKLSVIDGVDAANQAAARAKAAKDFAGTRWTGWFEAK